VEASHEGPPFWPRIRDWPPLELAGWSECLLQCPCSYSNSCAGEALCTCCLFSLGQCPASCGFQRRGWTSCDSIVHEKPAPAPVQEPVAYCARVHRACRTVPSSSAGKRAPFWEGTVFRLPRHHRAAWVWFARGLIFLRDSVAPLRPWVLQARRQ